MWPCKPTMESLPQEMIEDICQYLAAVDLANCCAVSHSWREVFGQDRLWRVHCDEALSDQLDVRKCAVEPHFTSPENEDTTLSAIGEWRLNYMKEVRLRNNWSLGRFKKEELWYSGGVNCNRVQYFGNDVFLRTDLLEIDVFDVNENVTLNKKVPLTLVGWTSSKLLPVDGTNKLVVVNGAVVRVYNLCIASNTLRLLHVFAFQMTEKCSESTEEAAKELCASTANNTQKHIWLSYDVVGKCFVGIIIEINYKRIHIWNVETGQKLKEEECPFSDSCVGINACENSMNIILTQGELVGDSYHRHWYVYSLTKMMLLPFHKVLELGKPCCCSRSNNQPVIYDKFIAIIQNDTLRVYNCLTSDLLYTVPSVEGMFYCKHYLVFRHDNTWHAYNPISNCASTNLGPAGGHMDVVYWFTSDDTLVQYATIKIKEGRKTFTYPLFEVPYLLTKSSNNKFCTKVVMRKTGGSRLTVVRFW